MEKKEVDEKIAEFGKELSVASKKMLKDLLDTITTLTQEKVDMIKEDTDKQEFLDRVSEVMEIVDKDVADWLEKLK